MNGMGELIDSWWNWPMLIIGIIVIIITGVYVFQVQIEHYQHFQEYCDNTFGVNNWTTVPVDDEDRLKYYIGSQQKCVGVQS